MKYYPAILHKDDGTEYGLSFPDFPGCIGAGPTTHAAVDDAYSALKTHMEIMAEDGEAIPEPSEIEAVRSNPDYADGTIVMVPAPRVAAKIVRVNITLPDSDLLAFDSFAGSNGLTRSGLIAIATRSYISERSAAVGIFDAQTAEGTNNVTVLYRDGINSKVG